MPLFNSSSPTSSSNRTLNESDDVAARAESSSAIDKSSSAGAEWSTAGTENSSAEALTQKETAGDTTNEPSGEAQLSQPGSSRVTPHTQPDWLDNLKKNFVAEIIETCSVRTKKAVENNEKIEVDF